MIKHVFSPAIFLLAFPFIEPLSAQTLTIDKIMQDPTHWVGDLPEQIQWSEDGQRIYFMWNPEREEETSLYGIRIKEKIPYRATDQEKKNLPSRRGSYNKERTKKVYEKYGDIFLMDITTGISRQITGTLAGEHSPEFNFREDRIIFTRDNNLFTWDFNTGQVKQVTDFQKGSEPPSEKPYSNEQEKWLYEEQLKLFKVLRERKHALERREEESEMLEPERPETIYTGRGNVAGATLSPDERYVTYLIYHTPPEVKRTEVPDYVTESGYTAHVTARPKVGSSYYSSVDLFIYDRTGDSVYQVKSDSIPGIHDRPDYFKDYPVRDEGKEYHREVMFGSPVWSGDGKHAVVDIFSADNKDRWIMLLDVTCGRLDLLDRQHDDAYIGGPGIGRRRSTLGWMPGNRSVYFQSEETGYSHLYTVDITSGKKKALTQGSFEIYDPFISRDKQLWYFTSNEVHPGERHFYSMPVRGGRRTQLTFREGRQDVTLSPGEHMMAIRYSASNRPWELYIMENKKGATPVQVTSSPVEEFKAYPWRIPEIVHFTARDGARVPARLYRPGQSAVPGPAVIFVHGAGYLQNAHKWWSTYFREYMFHNFLVDNGYTVLDIDYRGSAGYGRDWRRAVYRHMGGKDLDDQVDGARFLCEQFDIDPARIGIYGGSYGGFMTLMAMFTRPGVFSAGAALRSVTDWAHYNHGYTANILNTPVEDSLAYVKSSPIYYAEGLEGALLMCHGVIDKNVHFQDIVRLTQRLIELGKENWELAVYPLEGHSFTEPTSWTDEYKRILRLFEENLR
jgi:dipeptidyl aminopeptidase/acylaminoacyl peptidase